MGREDEIKVIAYQIWEEEGCVDGRDCEHWLRAEVIWEQQQKQEAVTQTNKSGSKKASKQSSKATGTKKKTTKT